MNKKIFDTIKSGFENGVYHSLRLCKIDNEGNKIIIIPFSGKKGTEPNIHRLKHIKLTIDKSLEAGKYIIQCKTGVSQASVLDEFEVEIKQPVLIPLIAGSKKENDTIEDKTFEQETMKEIDFDDYINLIKENEALKAQNSLLLTQLELAQKQPLSDSGNISAGEKILGALGDNIGTILGVFDRYMNQRDKVLELKERTLDIKTNKKIIPNKINNMTFTDKDTLVYELDQMYESDPSAFDSAMDFLYQKDIEMYNYVVKKLGLEDFDNTEDE